MKVLKIALCGPDEFGVEFPQTLFSIFLKVIKSSEAHRFKTKTQTHPFIVHRSMLRCSNLAESLLNETPRTGSCIYRTHGTGFSNMASLTEKKAVKCFFLRGGFLI